MNVSVLFDMNSGKKFYYSLIWNELSENVNIDLYKLWKKCAVLFASNSLKMSVLFDANSGNLWSVVYK